jgi:hypothetical protein
MHGHCCDVGSSNVIDDCITHHSLSHTLPHTHERELEVEEEENTTYTSR